MTSSVHLPKTRRSETVLVVALLLYAGLVALFWADRYGGMSIDGDAARLSLSAEGILQEGKLTTARYTYPSGIAFQAALAFVGEFSGVAVQRLQLASSAWLVVIALLAFVCYRELTGRAATAILAALLLLLQPDFLFYVLRASHEKLTWTLALLALYLLARSHRVAGDLARFAVHVLLFYLVLWAMVSTNTFFASSFLGAILFSLAASYLLRLLPWWRAQPSTPGDLLASRLVWISLAGMVLVFAFITYLYRPAALYYSELGTLIDRLSALFLGAQPVTRSVEYVQAAWRSPVIYLGLTGSQWLIVLLSFAGWVRGVRRLAEVSAVRRLLWLMYGGFGTLLAIGTVIDLAGYLNANLQVRLFTAFALVSSPMAALFVSETVPDLGLRFRRALAVLAAVAAGIAVVASLLKATNDPSLGNQWLFYSPAETQGLSWVESRVQDRPVWVDTSPHLLDVFSFWQGYTWQPGNSYQVGPTVEGSPEVFYSRLTRLQANRTRSTLPSTVGYNRVYDNGVAQFFHRRPRTPYQR